MEKWDKGEPLFSSVDMLKRKEKVEARNCFSGLSSLPNNWMKNDKVFRG